MQFSNHRFLSIKQILCYYGAFFEPTTHCEPPATSSLVIYYTEKPAYSGLSAPFSLDDFLSETKKLANKHNVKVYQDQSLTHNKFESSKQIQFRKLQDNEISPANAIVLSPSPTRLHKRDSNNNGTNNSTNDQTTDISSDFSIFIFTVFGLIIAIVLSVQLIATAAPPIIGQSSGGRLKSE
eukprot:NODE_232_length_12051_cov_1.040997.p8 type:complete len:181 gc:universal NODE_232_length_12051_cov_1.040997:4689-5231(+)